MKKRIGIIVTLMLVVSMMSLPLFAKAHRGCVCCAGGQGQAYGMNTQQQSKDIVEVAIGDNRFQTLVAALQAAELVDTLKGEGPFTVFAPTNAAFSKLPQGTLDDLLKPENKETLGNILKYHVFPGNLTAVDVVNLDGQEITMVNGDKAKIEVKDGTVFINGAQVVMTDIMTKNGVIHVIDTVIMPPND
jgi:uncharacterized surface protein with fasciclin (FAS1) repeats